MSLCETFIQSVSGTINNAPSTLLPNRLLRFHNIWTVNAQRVTAYSSPRPIDGYELLYPPQLNINRSQTR